MIARNLPELFINQANKYSKKVAVEYRLRRNEPYKPITWERLCTMVYEIAYGLEKLGIKKGERVAIISDTRYEWSLCDLGVLLCGGIVVPIYPTLTEDAVEYIINNSGCEIVIVENKGQLQKIRSQWQELPTIKHAIVIDDFGDLPEYDKRILSLGGLKDIGKLNFSKDSSFVKNQIASINSDDLATIIYTSGTTGNPKGVELTHENILSVVSVLPKVLPLRQKDKFLSFLPLSHVFERVGGLYYAISTGTPICYCSNMDQIGSALRDSGATIMLVVPRLLEKIYYKLNKHLEALPENKKKITNFALSVGKKIWQSRNKNFSVSSIFENIEYKILDLLVFSNIRKNIAPTLECFVSGGAPLSPVIAEFFCVIGIPVLEGYGLTETSAPSNVNTLKKIKPGTVGRKLPNVEIKIADDGEILIKGPTVFRAYYKNPEATNEAFADGWFKTGDIGVIDEDGFLKITDRKKDIIVSSAGKKVAPQNIENILKTSPYISNAVVIGDKRKYLSALITLENLAIQSYAKENNLMENNGFIDLVKNPKIIKFIEEEIKTKTADSADFEQIRKFTILPNDFTVEAGEITPTLKVKRKFVSEKYKDLINLMYPPE